MIRANPVIPAKAGSHDFLLIRAAKSWIPAFAGMTERSVVHSANDSVIPQRTLTAPMLRAGQVSPRGD
jgi:hypothetical protein